MVSGAISVGDVLGDKYAIEAELGAGAMGLVFRARHQALNKLVAVKTLRAEIADNPELLGRFEQEARAASAIGHPNIVAVFDLGTSASGARYMVMEHLDGQSLADLLVDTSALDPDRSVRIMSQVLSALAAAHRCGIVHRDLKPENIFVTYNDDNPELVKLLDFGISKVLEIADPNIAGADSEARRTQFGSLLGTPLYMSPEQARGSTDIDHRSDLWASGCVLYEMLCAQPPFDGANYHQILHSILNTRPARPTELQPSIPAALERVIMRAITHDRDQRYSSAKQMRDELQASLADAPGFVDFSPAPTPPPRKPLGSSALAAAASGPTQQDAQLASALANLNERSLSVGVSDDAATQRSPAPAPKPAAAKSALGADVFAPPAAAERDIVLDVEVAPAHPLPARTRSTPEPGTPRAPAPRRRSGSRGSIKLLVWLLAIGGLGVAGFMLYRQREVVTGPKKSRPRVPVSIQVPQNAELEVYLDGKPLGSARFEARLGQRYVVELRAPHRLTRRFVVVGKNTMQPIAAKRLHLRYEPLDPGDVATPLTETHSYTGDGAPSPAAIDKAFETFRLYRTCLGTVGVAIRKTTDSYAPVNPRAIRRLRVKNVVPVADDVVDACRVKVLRARDRGGLPVLEKAAAKLVDSLGQLNRATQHIAAYYASPRYKKDRGREGLKIHRRLTRLLRQSRADHAAFAASLRAHMIEWRGLELAALAPERTSRHYHLRALLYASLRWAWSERTRAAAAQCKARARDVVSAHKAYDKALPRSPDGTYEHEAPLSMEPFSAIASLAAARIEGGKIDSDRVVKLHNAAVKAFNGMVF